MTSYSPYKISMFLQCPCKYKFCYIDKLSKKFEKPKPHFTLGENIHATLKEFLRLPPKERTYQKLEVILRKLWQKNRRGFSSLEEEKKYGQEALIMLKNFYQKGEIRREPLVLEEQHKIEIQPGITILGKIDRIDQEKGGLHIIDYKTGKERDEEKENSLQFLLYPLIITRKMNQIVKKISYFYLTSGKYFTKEVFPEDIEQSVPKILELIEEIEKEKEFAPKISNLCKEYCDFITICPKRFEIDPQRFNQNIGAPF